MLNYVGNCFWIEHVRRIQVCWVGALSRVVHIWFGWYDHLTKAVFNCLLMHPWNQLIETLVLPSLKWYEYLWLEHFFVARLKQTLMQIWGSQLVISYNESSVCCGRQVGSNGRQYHLSHKLLLLLLLLQKETVFDEGGCREAGGGKERGENGLITAVQVLQLINPVKEKNLMQNSW